MKKGFPEDNDDIEEFIQKVLRGASRGRGRDSETYYDIVNREDQTAVVADMPGLDSEENIEVKVKGKKFSIVGINSNKSYRIKDSLGFEITDYTIQYNNGVLEVRFDVNRFE